MKVLIHGIMFSYEKRIIFLTIEERKKTMNTKHLIKVWIAWVNIAYVLCFLLVLLLPEMRIPFVQSLIHVEMRGDVANSLTFGNFFWGIILWNILTLFGVSLFGFLFNILKK